MIKHHHIVYILASKTKTDINDNHIELGNILKCTFGKTNEAVKIIDVMRDHANDIINNIDSMSDIMRNRTSKRGYKLFATDNAINKAITFFNSNIALIIAVTTAAGWFKINKPFTKKPVYCITINRYFDSIKEAAEALRCTSSGISKCCRGIQNTTAKMQFRYA